MNVKNGVMIKKKVTKKVGSRRLMKEFARLQKMGANSNSNSDFRQSRGPHGQHNCALPC